MSYSKEEYGTNESEPTKKRTWTFWSTKVVASKIGRAYSVRTERMLLNISVKQPLGVSPNTPLFGNAFSTEPTSPTQSDRGIFDVQTRSTKDFVDTSITREAKIIDTAIHSQTAINEANLRNRNASYACTPKLRQRVETEVDDHLSAQQKISISYIFTTQYKPKPPNFSVTKYGFKNGIRSLGSKNIFKKYSLT